jgi:Sedlin, N-terminal conserved region
MDRLSIYHTWQCVLGLVGMWWAFLIYTVDMKFVLLHDAKGDDSVKIFFLEVWELYVKVR